MASADAANVAPWRPSSARSEIERLIALERKFGKEGLTFDDVLLLPAESHVLPNDVSTITRLTPSISLNIPVDLGRDGHRDRGAPRDRAGARGRSRHRPPQPLDRRSGRGGRQGEALGVGDDRRARDASRERSRRRRPRAHGALPDLRRADHRRRRRPRRHPHEPRPPLRDRHVAARLGADDEQEPRHCPGRHDARRRPRRSSTATRSRSCRSSITKGASRGSSRSRTSRSASSTRTRRRTSRVGCVSGRRSASGPMRWSALPRSSTPRSTCSSWTRRTAIRTVFSTSFASCGPSTTSSSSRGTSRPATARSRSPTLALTR